ncbi:hypothetical protein TraAM80_08634 [Trypanosoma rangeli]|uniref:Uncharacterized protein n=1 Tax=Trypanosoma rangeli TaxID=5698 RepID=A0A3R7JY05_TRYRA|nr:uncharacterized protein TraAM80_08634 [Trypanosoma rangeli]RNE98673.1 hypothetical protein TraAM80_08634 [Trypanosoma rangeli]|eukprot:RNE98673.1 hypothetical protein TraAM80_08634 [Trypanosoma rangeli]
MTSCSPFLEAAAAFIKNIVAVGVCSNEGCLNAFNPTAFGLPFGLHHGGIPVTPPNTASLEAAIAAEVFPLGTMGRRLCSSPIQLGVTLEEYITGLFTTVQHQFGCSMDTILHCLWIVERIQTRNILVQQKSIISLRSISQCRRGGEDIHLYASEGTQDVALTARWVHDNDGMLPDDSCQHAPLCSSMSSEVRSMGPVSDVADDDSLCYACAGSPVFSLQFWNVQLFITASLLLSLKVGEDKFAETDGEALTVQLAALGGCDTNVLLCAERCVCDLLWDELSVTTKGLESVMRRLGMRSLARRPHPVPPGGPTNVTAATNGEEEASIMSY